MQKKVWSKHKFHCSGLKHIMTKPRSKKELVSETTKAHLRDIYIAETWGRRRSDMLGNRYVEKGTMCETDSLQLLEQVTGKKYFKNQKNLTNDWITGTADVSKPELIDMKTSWDLHTYMAVDETKARYDYYYQLLGYMWLWDYKKSSLIYALVDTPAGIANDEILRLSYRSTEEEAEKYRNNYEFKDIPPKYRIKKFDFEYSEKDIDALKDAITRAREYLQTLELKAFV